MTCDVCVSSPLPYLPYLICLRNQVWRRSLLEHLDSLFLMLDECTDGGSVSGMVRTTRHTLLPVCLCVCRIIFETDPAIITQRSNMLEGEPQEGQPFQAVSDQSAVTLTRIAASLPVCICLCHHRPWRVPVSTYRGSSSASRDGGREGWMLLCESDKTPIDRCV